MYWIPLADLVGIDGRWAGPFDHPGRSGQAGAIVLVWGITRIGSAPGRASWLSGLAMVLLAGSNTAYLAAAAGACVVLAAWGLRRVGPLPRWVAHRPAASSACSCSPSSSSARTWGSPAARPSGPPTSSLWQELAVDRGGEAGIAQAITDGRLPAWAYHAHNSWLDLLARNGVLALVVGGHRHGGGRRRGLGERGARSRSRRWR